MKKFSVKIAVFDKTGRGEVLSCADAMGGAGCLYDISQALSGFGMTLLAAEIDELEVDQRLELKLQIKRYR